MDAWSAVIWSDESAFSLVMGKQGYVRRRAGEELDDKMLSKTVKHGGGSVVVWGCFPYVRNGCS